MLDFHDVLCYNLPWALVAYCWESWTLALLIPLVVGLAVLVAEYQVTLGTLGILVFITSERCCPCLGLGSGCSEWKSKSGTQPHILSSCIKHQCSYVHFVLPPKWWQGWSLLGQDTCWHHLWWGIWVKLSYLGIEALESWSLFGG